MAAYNEEAALPLLQIRLAAVLDTVPLTSRIPYVDDGRCGVQLAALSIIGEYLGRPYLEAKHRPCYLLRDSRQARAAGLVPAPADGSMIGGL